MRCLGLLFLEGYFIGDVFRDERYLEMSRGVFYIDYFTILMRTFELACRFVAASMVVTRKGSPIISSSSHCIQC